MSYGTLGTVQVDFQNSFGTLLTDSLQPIPIISETINETIEQITEGGMRGRLGEPPIQEGARAIGGNIVAEAHPIAMGSLLKSVFGQVTTTSDTNDQTHVFQPRTADFDDFSAVDPLTILIDRDVSCGHLYYDMLGSRLELSISQGQLLQMTTDFMGGKFQRNVNATPTYPAGSPFPWRVSSASFAGAVLNDLRDFTVTLDNNLENFWTLQDCSVPYRTKRNNFLMAAGNITMLFTADSVMTDFLDQTENAFTLFFTGPSSPATLRIDVPSMRLGEYSPRITGPGLLEVSAAFKGVFNANSNSPMGVTLVNTQTFY